MHTTTAPGISIPSATTSCQFSLATGQAELSTLLQNAAAGTARLLPAEKPRQLMQAHPAKDQLHRLLNMLVPHRQRHTCCHCTCQ